MPLDALAHPFANLGASLIWLSAVSAAVGVIWRTWLRHVFLRTRQGVDAVIELRDLMKTELHLPGDDTPGAAPRLSLREDLQALTGVLGDAVAGLAHGSEKFQEHDRWLEDHEGRLARVEEVLSVPRPMEPHVRGGE
jgi:hypothetical protein